MKPAGIGELITALESPRLREIYVPESTHCLIFPEIRPQECRHREQIILHTLESASCVEFRDDIAVACTHERERNGIIFLVIGSKGVLCRPDEGCGKPQEGFAVFV